MLNDESIRTALKTVKYPGYSRDIVSFGLLKQVVIREDAVGVLLNLTTNSAETALQIKQDSERAILGIPGVKHADVEVQVTAAPATPAAAAPGAAPKKTLPGIKRVIAIASGKGGVGKSTVSVNLACALAQLGHEVGLLDCDIYGPSIPLMMGINQRPLINGEEKLVPPMNHGVKLMSMGFLVNDDQPVIWRGPMIQRPTPSLVSLSGEIDVIT